MAIGRLPRMSLELKIIASLVLFVAAILVLGGVSAVDLSTIGQKIEVLSLSHRLSDVILEARRYEKNFLLYAQADDLAENRRAMAGAEAMLDEIAPEVRRLRAAVDLTELRRRMREYAELMEVVAGAGRAGESPPDELVKRMREAGKAVLDATQAIAATERERVDEILGTLRWQLWLSIAAVMLLGPLAVLAMFRNVLGLLGTVRKSAEAIGEGRFSRLPVPKTGDEVERVLTAFNHMVGELEVRQEQLVQARKLSSIGTLAAGIAHQLNNPLNNISTSCQIAREEFAAAAASCAEGELVARMLRNIEQESLRARDIVQGLLEFSRQRDFEPRQTPLRDMLARTRALVSSQVPPNVSIEIDVPEELTLFLDSRRMQEVFLNLFLNAVEAIGGAQGKITVTARVEPEAGEAVILVQDDGPGIPEEVRLRIFDPFYTTKNDAGGSGTGLGLSIAYGIVERHGGRISAEPANEGARFVIRLPLDTHLA